MPPNTAQLSFISKTLAKLQDFTHGTLKVGSDLNCSLNPLLDTSDGKSYMSQQTLRTIQKKLDSLNLVDTWRFVHPDGKDFTFFSNTSNKYTRIDYIFLLQRDLTRLAAASIGNIITSDHAPTSQLT